MINEYKAHKHCCEPIELIENYDAAVADTTQVWHCHHRLGVRDGVTVTEELKANGLYEHRPANELIFVTRSQHNKLHPDVQLKRNKAGGKKGGKAAMAKRTSEQQAKCTKGKLWWNNGAISRRSVDCPGDGFVRGRLKRRRQ